VTGYLSRHADQGDNLSRIEAYRKEFGCRA
jgi:hypothetical protein